MFLISIVSSVALFGMLMINRYKPNVDWSEPYSWTLPFFPMNSYPLRFWILSSYGFIAGGILALLKSVVLQNGHEAFGGTFLFWGLGFWVTLKIWIKWFCA
ncbi:MAG: hypothetical protein ACREDS_06340 [Limisphaerales bacterium]